MTKYPKPEIVARNWALGFNFAWPVFARYAVKRGILREGGKVIRVIAPVVELRLLETLASVHEGTIAPEDFASEFGLLGYSDTHEASKRRGGDPIDWFKVHAKIVFEVLNLLVAIGQKDTAAIRQALRCSQDNPILANPTLAAQRHLEIILNPHLEGIPRQLRAGVDGIRSVFKPRALVDVVYWRLADLAEGHEDLIRRCLGCGELFISNDPRRQYCPGKNCSMRLRVKRFRKKQKKGRKS